MTDRTNIQQANNQQRHRPSRFTLAASEEAYEVLRTAAFHARISIKEALERAVFSFYNTGEASSAATTPQKQTQPQSK